MGTHSKELKKLTPIIDKKKKIFFLIRCFHYGVGLAKRTSEVLC